MTATVQQLGARALRKLGLAIVPAGVVQPFGPTLGVADIAVRVLLERGITVQEAARPAALPPVGLTELGQRTLRAVGVNPVAGYSTADVTPPSGVAQAALRMLGVNPVAGYSTTDVSTVQTIAQTALRLLGVNPSGPDTGVTFAVIGQDEVARRALRAVGVNPVDLGLISGDSGITYTRAQMAVVVLQKLAVIASDETPLATDLQAATDRLTSVHDILFGWDDVNWGDDAVPSGISEFYIIMAANLLAPLFGKPANEDSFNSARDMVRQLAFTGAIAQSRAMAKVQSVQDMLVAEGLATWTVSTIPDAVAEPMAAMTAALLAPVHNKTPDQDAASAAMATIRRIALSGIAGEALAETQVGIVQDEMVASGLANWNLASIPTAVANAYAMMVEQDLGPTYGRTRDAGLRAAAKDQIRQVVLSGPMGEALAEQQVNILQDELVAEGLAGWTVSTIPTAVANAMSQVIEQDLAPVYGRERDMQARMTAKDQIRRVALSGPAGETLAEAKVQAVHETLNALGIVSWPVTAVPVARAEDYVRMAATLVAPMYRTIGPDEIEAMQASWDSAVERVRRAGVVLMAQERAAQRVQNVYDETNALGWASWTAAAIPSSVADAYTAVAAAQMQAADEGKPVDPALVAAAFQRIRLVAMTGAAGQALANQAVLDVHASLDARGRTRWTLYDLPDYAELSYVLKAAVLLGPDMGVKVDPSWDAEAEMTLMRIVSLPSAGRPVYAQYF